MNLVRGGRYNWKYQKERLVYVGQELSNGWWHQFALVENPNKVWCEVRESDLDSFEETTSTPAKPIWEETPYASKN